ncbi:hypothetical protein TNCV_1163491 [Trichonephila clavipes]|nr:hypothetical protein TNCV_1163491 [Trichonephila clavipes]
MKNADHHCLQLDALNKEIQRKRPSFPDRVDIILHHYNTRLQPAYSPDIELFNCNMCMSLQNRLDGNEYVNYKGVQIALEE